MIKTWGKGRNMDEFKVVRRHMRFTGRVQGVGFRYRAKYAANGMGITGWAKNEWDGSVEMEAQGTIAQINMMLKMIKGEMGRMGSCTRQPADPGGIQGGERGSAGHRGVGENMDGTVGGFSERNGTGQRI